ncbi:MAG: HEAT repeat domain-containing protein, partial [bacterium]|nr:HEAT repeat domain-containing protein [bacterium]
MTQASLLDQILSGENRQLQVLAASGLVPLPPEELIPIQVGLVASPDPEVSGKAATALQNVEPRLAAEFLAELAREPELRYFAHRVRHPTMLEAILHRKDTPRSLFVEMAPSLPEALQEALVLRQDAILDEPEILVALERNPQLTSYAKRRIWEYREHLLPKEKVPPKSEEEIEAEAQAVTEGELQEAIQEVAGKSPADGAVDLSELKDDQVRLLPVPMRVKVARGASRQVRNILIRDPNAQVALAVIHGNQLSDQEVEYIASSRAVVDEVLAEIPKRREWIRKYPVAKALVKNPRTHLPIALKYVTRLSMRDLRDLARDKNVADGVRTRALRLYQAKR